MEVRQLRDDEWRLYRELRLRALADAPRAFASTLAGEQAEPDDFWIERTATSAVGTTLLATAEGQSLGMVTVRLQGETSEEARLLAMWVAPEWRRRGAGRKLIDGAAEWPGAKGRRGSPSGSPTTTARGSDSTEPPDSSPLPSGSRSDLTQR